MATVAALDIALRARTKQFNRGMKKARTQLTLFGRASQGMSRTLKTAGLGFLVTGMGTLRKETSRIIPIFNKFDLLLGGVAAGGLVFLAKREADAIDQTAKFAKRIGDTSENLGGLEIAAARTGVQFNALQMGMQRMTRRIAEAAGGTGEAKDTIKALGLDAKQLAKNLPTENLKIIADRLKTVTDQSHKVRLAFKLFDSEGVALVNTLALGSDEMQRMIDFAKKIGFAVGEDAAGRIERMNDALGDLKFIFRAIIRIAVVELSPIVTVLAEKFSKWAQEGEGLGVKLTRVFEDVAVSIVKMFGEIQKATVWFRDPEAALARNLAGIPGFSLTPKGQAMVDAAYGNVEANIAAIRKAFEEARTSISAIQGPSGLFGEEAQENIKSTASLAGNTLQSITSGFNAASLAAGEFNNILKNIGMNLANMFLQYGLQFLGSQAFPGLIPSPVPVLPEQTVAHGVRTQGAGSAIREIAGSPSSLSKVRGR